MYNAAVAKDTDLKKRAKHLQKLFETSSYTHARRIASELRMDTNAMARDQGIEYFDALEQLAAKVLKRKASA